MDYRYSAIILKKREVGETDRLYTFYTREAGKVQALAKGVRKQEAKLASSLETMSESDVMVVRTRGTGKIAGAILENSFSHIRSNYLSLTTTLDVLKIFERMVDLEEPDEHLYLLLRSYLTLVDREVRSEKTEKVLLLSEAFLFQLLARLGYQLELGRCVVTGERLKRGERFGMSPSAGGVISKAGLAGIDDALPLGENAVKLLRLFATQPLQNIAKLTVETKDLVEITRFRRLFVDWVRR